MKKSKKINFLLVILLISMFIVIPNLLISIQRNFEIPIEEKNSNEIINTRPPQGSPVYYAPTEHALSVHVSGDYAYVADYDFGLAVIDVSDPTNPGTPVYEDTTGYAHDVYVSGDYAYVADWGSGLAVIDVSDPTNPGTPVYEDTTGYADGVYVSGDYAYVADSGSGLAVIDVSDPTNPGTPVYEDTTGSAESVYVSGDYAYVADSGSGLAVIDVSDPTNPGTPIYEDTTGSAESVYVSGDYAYLAVGYSGLAVIDVSDPTNPGTPIYKDMNDGEYNEFTTGVYLSGDYAYVSEDFSYVSTYEFGLAIVAVSDVTTQDTITITNPTSSSVWYIDNVYTITWTWTGDVPTVGIVLYYENASFHSIIYGAENDGGYTWTVPEKSGSPLYSTLTPGSYQICIYKYGYFDTVYVFSDEFEIRESGGNGIPGYNFYLLIGVISLISAILIKRRLKQ